VSLPAERAAYLLKFWYVFAYRQKNGTFQLPAELWQLSLPAEMWYEMSTNRSMVLANYLQNFDNCRYLQKYGMCCSPAEVWYWLTTCRTLTNVATCRNMVCALYLQKYGTFQLPVQFWKMSLPAETWYVLSTCSNMVLAVYLQNFDKCRYLQKFWHVLTTSRSLIRPVYLLHYTSLQYIIFLNLLLNLQWHWALISNYCLWRSNFKCMVNLIVQLTYV